MRDNVVSVAGDEHYVSIKKSMSPYKGLGAKGLLRCQDYSVYTVPFLATLLAWA